MFSLGVSSRHLLVELSSGEILVKGIGESIVGGGDDDEDDDDVTVDFDVSFSVGSNLEKFFMGMGCKLDKANDILSSLSLASSSSSG